ncbi:hypothetical protein FB567DRAFT_580925 [Paraphoma chrysanthemicola]|uniref:Mid2 domain-containing protein n=1 Tax=Paraphoma chrysanthemicola TaxID=798071 RepID=A0A8K0VWS9_9PLEO|nr:hypothetical protein FB567DRAFT_580925 [Paraphoma chrysanthemicola]
MVSPVVYLLVVFAVQAWCQTVQDDWVAPAAPDESTSVQSGFPFTLMWKTTLQNNFKTYCPSCDVRKLDLWVTSFNGKKYKYKIGGSVDITSITLFRWDVNVPSAALSDNRIWVLRFTAFGSTDPFTEQISSSAFSINGPPQPSTVVNTVTAQPSIATSSVISSSSTPASLSVGTSSSTSFNLSPSSTVITTPAQPNGESNSKTWLAGVVIGPVVGIAIGAALTWFLLRRRKKNKKTQHGPVDEHNQNLERNDDKYSYQSPEQAKPTVLHEGMREQTQWQSHSSLNGQYPVEAPDGAPPPAELWQGNYRA